MADAALFRVDPAFGGVEWLHARFDQHAYDMHSHAEYVVAVVDEGAEAFHCRGETHVADAGSIYTINPNEPHDGRAAKTSWRYRALYPSQSFVERALGEGAARPLAHIVWRDDRALSLLAHVHDLLAAPSCALARQSAMVAALQRLFAVNGAGPARTLNERGREPSRLRRVRDLLCERFTEAHGLESLAAEAGLHPNYLLAVFKQQYGLTPAALLRSLRLAHAKAMIRAGSPLKAVAQEAGFFDQAHLTRCFRRAFGATPSAYAAACSPEAVGV